MRRTGLPQLIGIVVLVLSVVKTIKESGGVDIFAALPSAVWNSLSSAVWNSLIWLAVGLFLGSALN